MSVVVTAAEKLLLACYAGPEQDAIDALVKLEDLVSNHVESGALPPCEDNSTSTLPAAPHQLMLNAVNIKDAHGGTPLLYAVRLGAPSLCSGLIARGASVTDCAMQPSGNGPLHLAALQISVFTALGESVGVANAGGDTPLHFAACRGSVAVAGMLLRAERNSKAVGTTSSGAAAADRGPAFHPLGEAQAGVTPPQAEVTPQTGVITPRSGGSERLLCLANTDGVTPLLAAAASGSHMCLQVFLRHLKQADNAFHTSKGGPEVASHHVVSEQIPNDEDVQHVGGRHGGTSSYHTEAILWRDRRGNGALHYACGSGHVECVKLLLDEGCPVDLRNASGRTPLLEARQQGDSLGKRSGGSGGTRGSGISRHAQCALLVEERSRETSVEPSEVGCSKNSKSSHKDRLSLPQASGSESGSEPPQESSLSLSRGSMAGEASASSDKLRVEHDGLEDPFDEDLGPDPGRRGSLSMLRQNDLTAEGKEEDNLEEGKDQAGPGVGISDPCPADPSDLIHSRVGLEGPDVPLGVGVGVGVEPPWQVVGAVKGSSHDPQRRHRNRPQAPSSLSSSSSPAISAAIPAPPSAAFSSSLAHQSTAAPLPPGIPTSSEAFLREASPKKFCQHEPHTRQPTRVAAAWSDRGRRSESVGTPEKGSRSETVRADLQGKQRIAGGQVGQVTPSLTKTERTDGAQVVSLRTASHSPHLSHDPKRPETSSPARARSQVSNPNTTISNLASLPDPSNASESLYSIQGCSDKEVVVHQAGVDEKAEDWQVAVLERMESDCPGSADLDVLPQHVLGLDLPDLSMAQLDALEVLHHVGLARVNEARLALVRAQERLIASEQARRERDLIQLISKMELSKGNPTIS